jgi:hypothetical protein
MTSGSQYIDSFLLVICPPVLTSEKLPFSFANGNLYFSLSKYHKVPSQLQQDIHPVNILPRMLFKFILQDMVVAAISKLLFAYRRGECISMNFNRGESLFKPHMTAQSCPPPSPTHSLSSNLSVLSVCAFQGTCVKPESAFYYVLLYKPTLLLLHVYFSFHFKISLFESGSRSKSGTEFESGSRP